MNNIVRNEEVDKPVISLTGEKFFELMGIKAKVKTNQLSLARVVLEPGVKSLKHFNKSVELYYMTKGCAEITISKKTKILVPGDFCLIESGVVHQIKNNMNQNIEFFVISSPAWQLSDQKNID